MENYKEMNKNLPDIQNKTEDFVKKSIHKVGITNYKVPIKLYYPNTDKHFSTIAKVSAYASLPSDKKGVNMSRFSQTITACAKDNISHEAITQMLIKLKENLECENIYVKLRFDYLYKTLAPESKIASWFNIPIIMEGELVDDVISKFITVEVNYTSLCPCSKEISKYGAHNQRSMARIKVELGNEILRFEDFKEIVDLSVSCPIFNTLKRIDEKFVTEKAYDNPSFSEDAARNIAKRLDKWLDREINDYSVVTENYESIHQSNAVAIITAGRNLK